VTPVVLAVVGARPNFVKSAPVIAALEQSEAISVRLLHTGQHYDRALSGGFIERLGMREPDANLGVGSGTHAEQTAAALTGIEADLLANPADLVLVAGDVNSTLAAALAATKLGVGVAHIESGLRSRDWEMPEAHRPSLRRPALHFPGRG
jgi:UDP-N-acetylglucosamine 2-epimerase (non-hydrolysing)